MSALFKKKQLTPTKRVCLRLREARENTGISLEDLAKKTRICKKYLQALEECRFNDLPTAEVYQKNFVKIYVEALGKNAEPFLKQYIVEEKVRKDLKHPCTKVNKFRLSNFPGLLRYGVGLLAVLILLFYLGFQVKRIVEPPSLTLFSPEDGFITRFSSLTVQGETQKEVRVYLNGKEIMNNENGQFKEILDLTPGVNTIEITAVTKHGKKAAQTRHVIYKDSTQISLGN